MVISVWVTQLCHDATADDSILTVDATGRTDRYKKTKKVRATVGAMQTHLCEVLLSELCLYEY
jgi:hypothetical protein